MLTAVSFEGEAEEPGSMNRPPRPRTKPLLDWAILARICLAGGFSAFAALYLIERHSVDFEHARWLAYTALVVGQVVRANANRSLAYPVLLRRPNPFCSLGGVLCVAIQVVIPLFRPSPKRSRRRPSTRSTGCWSRSSRWRRPSSRRRTGPSATGPGSPEVAAQLSSRLDRSLVTS